MFQRSMKNTLVHISINKHKGKLHMTKKLEWREIPYLQQAGRTGPCPSEGKVDIFFFSGKPLLIHQENSEHAQLGILLNKLSYVHPEHAQFKSLKKERWQLYFWTKLKWRA